MKKILVPLALMPEIKNAPLPIHFVRENYIHKLTSYGLIPIFVSPAFPRKIVNKLSEEADGLLCMGGPDLEPALYGEKRHPKTVTDDPRRDQLELDLVRCALKDKKPILAICRGIQTLNVAAGGTLIQHLPDRYPQEIHANVANYYKMVSPKNAHPPIQIKKGTKAFTLIKKSEIAVISAHHQAVSKLGRNLRVSAASRAGVIELIEHVDPNYFCFGIQSHPECCMATPVDGVDKSGLEIFFAEFAKAVK